MEDEKINAIKKKKVEIFDKMKKNFDFGTKRCFVS